MFKVDLILPPPFIYFRKCQSYFFPFYRSNIKWFPVYYYKNELEKMGVKVRFLNYFNLKYNLLSEIVGVDDDIRYIDMNYILFLKKLKKKVNCLIWFDHTDNSSFLQREIFPYIDRYFKRQLLKDRLLYENKFYNDRIFCDFYAKNYFKKKSNKNLNKDIASSDLIENNRTNLFYKEKIGLSWNLSLCNYRDLWDSRFYKKLKRNISMFSNKMSIKFYKPSKYRKLLFSANFSIFINDPVGFQRRALLNFLIEKYRLTKNISIGFVPKKLYWKNAISSKAIFSPFGYGEICFRDFEAFLAGASLIKPDMDHIETWPNIYIKNKTYLPLSWHIKEWECEIPEILSNERLLFDIAKNGQNIYKRIWTREGRDAFCNHFIEMIMPK